MRAGGASGNSSAVAYELTIDLSVASNRFKAFVLDLSLLDPDGNSDTQSFEFTDTENNPSVGSITGSQWSFTPVGCSANKTETVQRNFFVKGVDATGTFSIREIHLILTNTKASVICPGT